MSARISEADVHVVLVVRIRSDNVTRSAQVGRVADEDLARACGDEAVEQLLGETSIDLRGGSRRLQPSVAAWVVDVDVEPVLVGDVLIHDTAVPEADVTDDDLRGLRVRLSVPSEHLDDRPDRVFMAVEPPGQVGARVGVRVPCDPVGTLDRKLGAVAQMAGVRKADGCGRMPRDARRLCVLGSVCSLGVGA